MAVPISTAEMNPTLSKKLRKVLEMRLDSPEVTSALTDISSFYTTNRPEHRRGLRAQLERRGVGLHQRMLEAFAPVAAAVRTLDDSVDQISDSCEAITERLRAVREQNASLIASAESIQGKREAAADKRELVAQFFGEIFLGPEEAEALTAGPGDPLFFGALERLQAMQGSSQVLLRVAKQRAGIEIMDRMSLQLEHAFEALYRWTVEQFKAMQGREGLELQLSQALVALRSRPALLDICLDEYVSIRKSTLLRQFLAALTAGGSGGMPRPIDMLAHEPTRFIGDMLAWVHESLAVERELLDRLCEGRQGSTQHSSGSVVGALLSELCGPIRGRLQQAVSGQSAVLCYKVVDVLAFYAHAIDTKCVAQHSTQHSTQHAAIAELCTIARDAFMAALQAPLDRLLRAPPAPCSDLTPAHSIAELIGVLEQMGAVCASSLVPQEHRLIEFELIASMITAPLLRACTLAAAPRSATDAAIFSLNAVSMLQAALAGHEFAAESAAQLAQQGAALMEIIVDEQTAALLRTGDIGDKIRSLSSAPQPVSAAAGMEAGVLMEAVRRFYHSIFGGNVVLMPQCDRIQLLRHRNEARSRISARVVAGYTVLWEAVQSGGYQDPSLIAPHTPEQFCSLLQ